MIYRIKNFMNNLFENFHHYSPGIMLIILGVLILIAPFLLVFIISTFLITIGVVFIAGTRTAIRENNDVKLFRRFVHENLNRWTFNR